METIQDWLDEAALLRAAEWMFTILFTIEYGLRLWIARSRWRYARSFFGVVDLLSILPTYVGLFVTGSHSLVVIRTFRILRIFRVLNLARFLREAAAERPFSNETLRLNQTTRSSSRDWTSV